MKEKPKDLSHWIGKRVKSDQYDIVKNLTGVVYCITSHDEMGIEWEGLIDGHAGESSYVKFGVNRQKSNNSNCYFCKSHTCTLVDEVVNNYELW